MNAVKKSLAVLLALLLCVGILAIPTYAAEVSQDGLEVTLTTDKDVYEQGETIVATLTVTNTSDADVVNVSLENLIPEGYAPAEGNETVMQVETLAAGETVTLTVSFVAEEPTEGETEAPTEGATEAPTEKPTAGDKPSKGDSPDTGDDSALGLWVMLMVAAVIGLAVLAVKSKLWKQMLSLVLCMAMVASMFAGIPLRANATETEEKTIDVATTVQVGDEQIELKAKVTYQLVEGDEPTEPEVTMYTVTFESNGGNEVAAQVVEKGMTVTKPELVTKADSAFIGWYADEGLSEYVDLDVWTVEGDTTLYAGWLELNNQQDSDGDALSDELEKLIGLDPTSEDTDGDGLADYVEIDILYLDPRQKDTDGDGVNDANEDIDEDSLSNLEEINLGTNPLYADSDEDMLSDYDEAEEYRTDPLNRDTDSDGVSDGKEIELGTDPLIAQASFELIVSSDEEDTVTASVEIELPGELVETLEVAQVVNDTFFTAEMPGYLGSAYDFSVDGTFESAVIRFAFDEALLNTENFDPVIFYYNEEAQTLEELDTIVEGNIASAVVEHFSTYILINRNINYSAFTWKDVWDTDTFDSVEVVLVIDDSGSLGGDYGYDEATGYFTGGNDPEHLRLAAAREFVENSSNAAKIGIVKFDGSVDVFSELTVCDSVGKETLKNLLQITPDIDSSTDPNAPDVFDSRGSTYMYTGIDTAFNLFTSEEETDETILRVVVVFTDGQAHDSSMHGSVISEATKLGVKIYSVGLGSSTSYFTNYLEPLAEATGGSFYMTADAAQLAEIYEDISDKIDIKTDSDYDGIPDYYEDHMVAFDGTRVPMDKYSDDTDGDGLKDGEEITLTYIENEDGTQITYFGTMYSNPTKIDSDGDGLYDNAVRSGRKTTTNGVETYSVAPIDPEPLRYTGPRGMWKEHIATQQNASVVAGDYGDTSGFDFDLPDWADELVVNAALLLQTAVTSNAWTRSGVETLISTICDVVKFFCGTEAHAVVGAYLLNFVPDNLEVGYHSQPDTWQRDFGYNDFYDSVFRIGSNMGVENENGFVGQTEYKLWMWKGDYWNLQTGAEIGLYIYDHSSSGQDHYGVVDFEVPMTLSLYNYYSAGNIDNVFNWAPEVDQWWVTGFNTDFENPNPNDMVSIGSIDFAGHTDIYDALQRAIPESKDAEYYIFDADGHTLWVLWS